MLKTKTTLFEIEKGSYCRRKWYHLLKEYGTIFLINMVPFSLSIWYHILLQYGTIFYCNMVPYSFRVSLLLKNSTTKIHFQNNPFSSSKCVSLHDWTDECFAADAGRTLSARYTLRVPM